MEITRKSAFTGIIRTLDLPVTEEQIKDYDKGEWVQTAFPQLTPDEREFIISGTTNEEWESVYEY